MAEVMFSAPPLDALHIEPLGELTAIFDRRSMQTHLVVAPMPEILAAMAGAPCSATTLADRLAAAFDLIGEGDAEAIVAERIAELVDMGLVAPA